MKRLALTALLYGTAIGAEFRFPDIHKKKPRVESPRGAEMRVSVSIIPRTKQFAVSWTYPAPMPRPAVEFDIEHAMTPDGPWQKIGQTNQPPYLVNMEGFYRVGAHRTL